MDLASLALQLAALLALVVAFAAGLAQWLLLERLQKRLQGGRPPDAGDLATKIKRLSNSLAVSANAIRAVEAEIATRTALVDRLEEQRQEASRKPVQALLEERMACGTGVCYSCAVFTRRGVRLVCKDGPMFELREVF